MSIIASKPKGEGFLCPAGTVQAVCYAVWDIGLQKQEWQGKEKLLHKIIISWEINEQINDPDGKYHGKRYVISQFYTLSLANKANLKRDLESWRGKIFTPPELEFFDVETLVKANCLLNIVHKETETRTYANIAGIMPLPKGMAKLTPENGTEPPQWVLDRQAMGQINIDQDQEQPRMEEPPPYQDDDLPF